MTRLALYFALATIVGGFVALGLASCGEAAGSYQMVSASPAGTPHPANPGSVANDAGATMQAALLQASQTADAQAREAQSTQDAFAAANIAASQTAQAADLEATRATASYLDAQATTTQAANATAQWYDDQQKAIENERLEIERQKKQLELDRQNGQATIQAGIDLATSNDRIQAIRDDLRIEKTYKQIKGFVWLALIATIILALDFGTFYYFKRKTDLGFWTVYHEQEERIARIQAGAQLAGMLSDGTTVTDNNGQKIPNPATSLKTQAINWIDESIAEAGKPGTTLRPGQLTGKQGRESDELRKAMAQAGLIYTKGSVGTFSRSHDLGQLRSAVLLMNDNLSPTPPGKRP